MTQALQRFQSLIFGWIPDISGIPPRRQATLGLIFSIAFHLLIILILAMLWITKPPPKIQFAKPKLRGIELTIQPPEPEPEPIVPFTLAQPTPETPFIDSRGLDIAQEAAKTPLFESDENMKAASEGPATGDMPLPSQSGRDRPFNAFKTQRGLLGAAAQPFPPAVDAPALPPPQPVTAPPPPKIAEQAPPPPESTPKTEQAEPTMKTPAPPTDLPLVDQPTPDQIALSAKPVPTPLPAPPADRPAATPQPVVATPPPQMAKLTTPAPKVLPRPPRETAYQPDQEANRIEGSITNRGRSAVDAIATPMGKFKKRVNDSIGSRWQMYVKDPRKMGLFALGSTRVTFYITREGRVQSISIDANSSNQSFADICVAAISDAQRNDAEIFQPPPGALDAMRDGRLEYTITFTLYSY